MNRYEVEDHGDKGRVRHGSPFFYELLERMAALHDKKSHDYASNENPAGNYHFAGKLALLFSHSEQDAGFVGRLGEKIYRLANLESSQKVAQNESIEDTELDCCVIMALWMSDRQARRRLLATQTNQMTARQLNERSEAACCQMISAANMLNPEHMKELRDYLTSCLESGKGLDPRAIHSHNAASPSRRTTE